MTEEAGVGDPADTASISGGHLVARALRQEGVDVVFTLCGGHIIDIYDGCLDEGIKLVDVRHEQVAAHAADGYARVTGRPGCAVVTAGPGTTDAVTGVANAFRAESPMLLIGGQGATDQHKMGSLQDLPHVEMMRPITKFAASVPTTSRVADMMAMAFRECYLGAPGPSYLEIPRDVLDRSVPLAKAVIPKSGMYRASTRSLGDPEDIQRLADLIAHSRRPCILLGQQVWTCRAAEQASSLCREAEMPAFMNGAGRGTLPPGDPHHFQLTRRYAFDRADLIIIVGTPFDFRLGYGKRLPQTATVVQIDLDYRTVGRNRDVNLGMVGDCSVILEAVLRALPSARGEAAAARRDWVGELRQEEVRLQEARLPKLLSESQPIHPMRLAHELNQFLSDDMVYIGDGGDVVTTAGQVLQPHLPGHWMDPGPLGTLGVGIGFAMASKLAQPEREVLGYFGDGALSLTGFDFETMLRFKLPFIGVVGNNSYMNQIRFGQIARYGRERGEVANKLGDLHYDLFAKALGGYGEEVRDPKDIRPALERARDSGLPSLINVWVDPDEFASGTMNQTMYK